MSLLELYRNSFTGLSKDVWSIALIYLVNRCGEMVIPFMSVYLTTQLGFGKTETGIVLFCFGLGALVGSNLGGHLSDVIGNFKVMVISLAGCGLGFISIIFFHEFNSLCLVMFVTAVFSSMFSPAAFSAVPMWGNPENKTRGFSLLRMAINLGFAIGPAVGGYLAYKFGYDWVFILDGVTCIIAMFVLIKILGHRKGKGIRKIDKNLNTKSPFKDGILLTVPVYFKEELLMDEHLIGYFFTANGILVFLLEMPLVYLIEKRKKFLQPMIAGALLIGIGYACLSLFSTPLLAIIFFSLLLAFGEVINFPLIPTLAMNRADEHNQGKYMGVVSMMFAMAFLLAPISGLPVIEHIGYEIYYIIAAAMSILSGLCLWLMRGQLQSTA